MCADRVYIPAAAMEWKLSYPRRFHVDASIRTMRNNKSCSHSNGAAATHKTVNILLKAVHGSAVSAGGSVKSRSVITSGSRVYVAIK